MSLPVAGKPYISLWPLPGGKGLFLDTLHRTLSWIEEHPDASIDEVQVWLRERYALKGLSAPLSYLDTIRTMGYIQRANKKFVLTQAGQHYLQSKDLEFALSGFLSECIGATEVLNAVKDIGIASTNMVHKKIQSQFPQWKTNNQPMWRLEWLLSFGCIDKVKGGYSITKFGERALEKYKGPIENGLIPSVAKKEEVAQLQRDSNEAKEEHKADEDRHAKVGGYVNSEEALLNQLIHDIERTARASDEATEFEVALSKCFAYLGFQAEHKSGSGDTDILLIAPLGKETYRVVVDGKSSKHGKVGTSAISWPALSKHRQLHNANHSLVVAPGFSTGDLYTFAKDNGTALLTVESFCAILRLHYTTPFSLDHLRHIFMYPGDVDSPLAHMKESSAQVSRLQQLIPDIIRELEEGFSLMNAPVSADALYLMLAKYHHKLIYSQDEVQEALAFLTAPFIGALRRVGEQSFVLEMPSETIRHRLRALLRRLHTNPSA